MALEQKLTLDVEKITIPKGSNYSSILEVRLKKASGRVFGT